METVWATVCPRFPRHCGTAARLQLISFFNLPLSNMSQQQQQQQGTSHFFPVSSSIQPSFSFSSGADLTSSLPEPTDSYFVCTSHVKDSGFPFFTTVVMYAKLSEQAKKDMLHVVATQRRFVAMNGTLFLTEEDKVIYTRLTLEVVNNPEFRHTEGMRILQTGTMTTAVHMRAFF
jgi:hypothetical protein